MFCNTCGTTMPDAARFCAQCGRAVPGVVSASSRRRPIERPREGRRVAGVCLALAQNLDVDVTLVRVLWVVFSVMFALVFGVVAYVAAWILIPEAPRPLLQPTPTHQAS
ncbi:MAG TPA: PspC domain-containing protein [Terriglobales bacterium]